MNRITIKWKRAGIAALSAFVGTVAINTAVFAAPAEETGTEAVQTTTVSGESTNLAGETETTQNTENGTTVTETLKTETKDQSDYYDKDGSIIGKLIIAVADGYAEVYEAPDEQSEVSGKIEKNAVATVVEESSEWYMISSGNLEGYVEKEDFAAGKEAEKLDKETYSKKAEVNATAVRVRTDRDNESEIALIVSKGDKFNIIEQDDEWTKVEVEGVGTGYIENSFCDETEERSLGITKEEEQDLSKHIEQGQEKAETVRNGGSANTTEAAETEKALLRKQRKLLNDNSYGQSEKTDAIEGTTDNGTLQAQGPETVDYEGSNTCYEEQTEAAPGISSGNAGSPVGQQVADYAWSFVGWLPYVWAGSDLGSGVDCSGFTMALYAQFGYSLAHDSNVQSCQGISVPLSEAQPGDIIVYSGHVGLYAGNGTVIHAPYPGTVVSADSVYMMPVLDVRRIAY